MSSGDRFDEIQNNGVIKSYNDTSLHLSSLITTRPAPWIMEIILGRPFSIFKGTLIMLG